MENLNKNIDTNLYSRQLGLYGIETMKKIMKLNILIYGLRGLGAEITKNIVLAGPKKVTLFDPNISQINDLTSNFFLTKEDIENQKRRDIAIIDKIKELNNHVSINIMEGNDLYENIKNSLENVEKKYDVVVITEFLERDDASKINLLCRNNKIGFIYTASLGIYGFCFVDFGDIFYIKDEKGEDPLSYCIKSISKDKKGIVKIDTTAGKIKLGNKDKVTFKEIEGMIELNNCEPMNIKIMSNDTIEICDTTNFHDYISGGIITEVKSIKTLKFTPLDVRFEIPYTEEEGIPEQIDSSKNNINEVIHIGLLALNKFYGIKKNLPELNNKEHSLELISYGKEIYKNKKKENVNWLEGLEEEYENFDEILDKTLLRISLWAKAEISPLTSFIGGVSAQEIVKYTGKFKPIHQWLWFDFSEVVENLNENIERNLKNDRYDDQIAIFGNEIQEKLNNSNIFIIGAGALGCEFLKTFSLMGVSSNKNNKVIITDNDNIEISNLNRQFLYRNSDVGMPKSITACKAIKNINKDFNCFPKNCKVGLESEDIFDEKFWSSQDYIINAVDNAEARIYINNQCLIFQKILIDSGTLGTIANSQVIIPNKTIHYIEPKNENEEEERIAMCTLRNYPTLITHCIEWARDQFDGYFVKIIKDLQLFCEDKDKYFEQLNKETSGDFDIQSKELEKIINYSKLILNRNFDDCLEIAFNEYLTKYNNDIVQILSDNPLDSKNEDGTKFWSANKRAPIRLPFDSNNELIILYIKKYAEILANSLSIPINSSNDYIINKCKSFRIKEYIPIKKKKKRNERYLLNDDEKILSKKKRKEEIESRLNKQRENYEKIKKIANTVNIPDYQLISHYFKISEFEKDNDSNGHVEFLYAASNLRAKNYRIDNCDINKVKMIAGKITPAIATTTAGIVGLVSLQLYTLKQTQNIDYLRDCNMNLSFNNYIFGKPIKCKYEKKIEENENIKFIPEEFTIWDFIIINKSMTIEQFKEYIKNTYNVNVYSINSNYLNLYDSKSNNINLGNKIEDIYNEISKIKIYENKKFLILEISGNVNVDNSYYEVKMPKIKYIFK